MPFADEHRGPEATHAEPTRVRLHRSQTLSDVVPYAYSATTRGETRPVFLAGVCPLDTAGVVVHPGDIEVQARQCVSNMETALQEAGARLVDVIYTRVLVATSSQDDLVTAWNVVHDAFVDHEVPSTLSGVTVLGWPGQMVELEVVAAVPVDVGRPRPC